MHERECSIQRRHQKLIEIAPSPSLSPELKNKMIDASLALAKKLKYEGLATIEFLVNVEKNDFRFVVSQIETAFLKSVEAGSFLTIETEILEIRRASSVWWQQIMDETDVVATQRVRAAITNRDGKPIRAPKEITDALMPFLSSFKNDE